MRKFLLATAFMAFAPGALASECGDWCKKSFWRSATVEEVSARIKAGADIVGPLSSRFPALPLAIALSDEAVVKVLIDAGADVNATVQYGLTTLMVAMKFSRPEMVPVLIAAGAPVDTVIYSPEFKKSPATAETALVWAFSKYNKAKEYGEPGDPARFLKAISQLIDAGAHRGAEAELLVSLAEIGARDLIRQVLDDGIDPSQMTADGVAPIVAAATTPNLEIIKMLVAAGADLSAVSQYNVYAAIAEAGTDLPAQGNDWNVLHAAATLGTFETIEYFLSQGASVHARAIGSQTPLHLAAMSGSADSVNAMIKAGADIEARDSHNRTPLFLASYYGSTDTVSALLAAGADVHTRARDLRTPIFGAVDEISSLKRLEILIAAGADVNAVDDFDLTPLHEAARWKRLAHIKMLLAEGAKVNVVDQRGRTPLDLAALPNRAETDQAVELLLSAGADPAL